MLFRGAARRLLGFPMGLLDEERGTAVQLGATNYYLRDPIMQHSPWADHAVGRSGGDSFPPF